MITRGQREPRHRLTALRRLPDPPIQGYVFCPDDFSLGYRILSVQYQEPRNLEKAVGLPNRPPEPCE